MNKNLRERVNESLQCIGFVRSDLLEAQKYAGAVDHIVLLDLIRQAVELENQINLFFAALGATEK